MESEILKIVGMSEAVTQNKRTAIEPETGKDTPTQDDKPGPSCVHSLSLGEEILQVQGPFLHGCEEVGMLHMRDCLSQDPMNS